VAKGAEKGDTRRAPAALAPACGPVAPLASPLSAAATDAAAASARLRWPPPRRPLD